MVTERPPAGALPYDRLLDDASPEFESVAVSPDDVCMQPYTSGSTGRPKGVLLTHGGQYWNMDMVRRIMMFDETDRGLVAVPLYHKNAMASAVKPLLMAGGAVVILPGFDAAEVIRAIARHRCTYLTGVPAMYRLLLNERRAAGRARRHVHPVGGVRLGDGAAGPPRGVSGDVRRGHQRGVRPHRGRAGRV